MELGSEFIGALITIIIIDLLLAGDNAIVIGLAARRLPKEQQKKAIVWGTVGAIGIRILATLAVVWLLKIPGLLLVGGLLLVWISYKLLVDDGEHDIEAGNNLFAAIRTIVIADAVMGLDNVIAIAGAAHGDYVLVILGLLISVPIMIWGSAIILRLMERYPMIIYFGAAVLAFTAAKMMVGEGFVQPFFNQNPWMQWIVIVAIVVGVLLLGWWKNKNAEEGEKGKREVI
ncbi:TerC family protein [Mechercharimyces sp. CAU 1602]|uniref:TerC family protein n=1 Tax=Mechercharimyces sp. CAU 1602 TaxID=2973933 RepID=UPI002163F5E2|nr:TerC family protein [Mechercharimyces sp. CAU 1602]MCS1351751.1 TerC family protein [Mechercharimyces sp. CAU 1602]